MEPSFFNGASNVKVAGDVTSETIHGDYIDQRRTTIKEKRIGRQVYHQEGSVGVINDHAKFTGTLNYGSPPADAHSHRSERRHMRDGSRNHEGGERAWAEASGSEDDYVPSAGRRPTERQQAHTAPSFFQNAHNVSVGGNVSSKTVHGNVYARGSKTITKENIPVQEYRQEGSVGVVNGHGEFGGVLNYGGSGGGPREPTGGRRQTHYPDSDETSSEGDHRDRRYRDQRGSVGVINDHGTFSGNLNYNAPPNDYSGEQRQRHGGDEYGLPPDGRQRPTRREQRNNPDDSDSSSEDNNTPDIDVRPSSPAQSVAGDIFGMYNEPAYAAGPAHQYGYGSSYSTGLAPPPRNHWNHQNHGYDNGRYPLSPSPRMAAASPHLGRWESQYPPTPRSPGPPPYPGPSQSLGGGRQQWVPPARMTQGRYGAPSGLTDPMEGMYLTPEPRAAYPSPPNSGHAPYPPEKGRDCYFN